MPPPATLPAVAALVPARQRNLRHTASPSSLASPESPTAPGQAAPPRAWAHAAPRCGRDSQSRQSSTRAAPRSCIASATAPTAGSGARCTKGPLRQLHSQRLQGPAGQLAISLG
eukprot:1241312-Pleurochrysis_carterae.AAC.4